MPLRGTRDHENGHFRAVTSIRSLLLAVAIVFVSFYWIGCVLLRAILRMFVRSTKNYMGRFTSGEGYIRVYEGAGKVLLNPAPYWRYRISAERGKDSDYPARATS